MATIEKRSRSGNTYYRARVRIKGFPEQQRSFKRLTDARLWAEQTQSSIRKGEFQNVVKTAGTKTLKNVIDRYRDEMLPLKAESTQRAQTTYLGFWERELGEYALAYIEPELITKKLKALTDAGDSRRQLEDGEKPAKPKSLKTVKHYRDMLAILFKQAKSWGWTGANPLDGVSRITKVRDERSRYLNDDERKKLLEVCRASDNEQLYPIVVFALSTGARKSEILKLTFDDIDLKRDVAILRDTKNGETRSVPVVGHLKALLKDQIETVTEKYEKMDPMPPKRWVFPRRDGQAPIDIRKAWENARDEAKLIDFRFHDLRHSTASYLAMNGASQVEIAEVLGHRTLQMVRRYAHLSESHVKGLVEKLDEKFF